jgi:hypothetical protein
MARPAGFESWAQTFERVFGKRKGSVARAHLTSCTAREAVVVRFVFLKEVGDSTGVNRRRSQGQRGTSMIRAGTGQAPQISCLPGTAYKLRKGHVPPSVPPSLIRLGWSITPFLHTKNATANKQLPAQSFPLASAPYISHINQPAAETKGGFGCIRTVCIACLWAAVCGLHARLRLSSSRSPAKSRPSLPAALGCFPGRTGFGCWRATCKGVARFGRVGWITPRWIVRLAPPIATRARASAEMSDLWISNQLSPQ